MSFKIKSISGMEILDSRGNPTVRAFVELQSGCVGEASVPSGASTGTHEAWELRDGGKRYGGVGVQKAVKNVNTVIAAKLRGMDAREQRKIDEKMLALDGTPNKKKLGANAILAVSLAVARAASWESGLPTFKYLRKCFGLKHKTFELPLATMNIINGGKHADNNLTAQEFMIVPHARLFRERIRIGSEVFHALKKILKEGGFVTAVGDEGGFAPNVKDNEDGLKWIMQAIAKAGYKAGKDVSLAMDTATSEYYKDGKYYFKKKDGSVAWTPAELRKELARWVNTYPFISLEDGLHEDDWDNWVEHTKELGGKISLVGDDLFVTNKERLAKGIAMGVANAILIKVNQIGSLTETMDTIMLAQKHNYKVSVSHRSGETGDTFIADLAVAVNADYLKSGSMSRSERVEKYNRVMEIERELGR
ncbi:phosphopyruvate hydratase [Candidatus Uhrbacteria bacterium RIFCSPLOWO2_02_FULL_51_9]|uniref:Enolase n=1 Tax=Candidatus Uhrbacteria bacterium RIFCSPLOWO2_02_FULL_51_9 TaxID=1802410 RepID=A0A1F7VET8_9BACT|nr:MAG: phosphopyruvate hydratase [Candidatus Uhrbacteria bacterium RIFCSPLOWO2_02_FULL_51_9]